MLKKLLLAFALSIISSSAFAVCGAIPLPILDGTGASRNISSKSAADGNCETLIDIDASSQFHADITAPAKIVDSGGVNVGTIKAASTPPVATDTSLVTALNPNSPGIITLGPATIANSVPGIQSSQYPGNATAAANPITGNATGSTGAVVGTLAGAASKTTFVCGFNVSAIGGVATVGPVTVAGLVGSSQVYQVPVNATAGQVLLTQNFNPCIPASAANTAITITTTADGTATAVDVNSWGYQL